MIIPLVVHHGPRAWSAPRTLHELVDGLFEHPELRHFVPDFELLIDDLAVVANEQLMERPLAPVAQLAAWLLRDGRDAAAIFAHLEVWASRFAEVVAQHPDASAALLRYILLSGGDHSLDEVRRTILIHIPAAEAPMASAGEQLIQQGFLRGRLATLRETLADLIEVRFGEPSPAATSVIEAAQEAELKRMLLRIATAATIEEVLSEA